MAASPAAWTSPKRKRCSTPRRPITSVWACSARNSNTRSRSCWARLPPNFPLPESPLDLKPPAIPPGLPSDLLERRPDVAAAERIMASDNAQIGVARAAFFPNLHADRQRRPVDRRSRQAFHRAGARLVGGRQPERSALHRRRPAGKPGPQRRPTYNESVANYRQQVLTAFQQVEDALSGLRVLEDQAAAYDKAVQSAQQTVDISTSRYREGLANFLEVITAQVTLLANQRVADQIAEQRLLTTIELIQALGGGWQDSTIYSTATSLTTTPPQPAQPTPSGAAPTRQ